MLASFYIPGMLKGIVTLRLERTCFGVNYLHAARTIALDQLQYTTEIKQNIVCDLWTMANR